MSTVPYVLNPADSAHAIAFAHKIHTTAEDLNKQVVALYGSKLFEKVQPSLTLTLDASYIIWHFPGVFAYVKSFFDNEPRITAFENAVALHVYLLKIRRTQPVLAAEVRHEPN